MADDPGALAEAALKRAGAAIDKATKDALRRAGEVSRKELNDQAAKAGAGPDKTYSGLKGSTLRVRLRYDTANGAVWVVPKGHWKIAEEGAKPHSLAGGRVKSGKHPGTKKSQGKRAWSKGRDAAFTTLEREIPKDVEREVKGAFDG